MYKSRKNSKKKPKKTATVDGGDQLAIQCKWPSSSSSSSSSITTAVVNYRLITVVEGRNRGR